MARKKKPRIYHFIVSRTPEHPTFAVKFGNYNCQIVLDEMQDRFNRARDRGEQIEFRCSASYDDQASIDATVAKINEVWQPMKVKEGQHA